MLKTKFTTFLPSIITILYYALQLCDTSPTFFQEYRKKQQKIRSVRLKKSAAEARLYDLRKHYSRREISERHAHENKLGLYHPNYPKWVKKDMLHNKVKGNIKRHNLAAKILQKDYPEMRDIFHHQTEPFHKESERIQEQKDTLKRTGHEDFTRSDIRDANMDLDQQKYDKFIKKARKCRDTIWKYNQYISTHQDQNRCSIL